MFFKLTWSKKFCDVSKCVAQAPALTLTLTPTPTPTPTATPTPTQHIYIYIYNIFFGSFFNFCDICISYYNIYDKS